MEVDSSKRGTIYEMDNWGVTPLEHALLTSLNLLHISTAPQLTRSIGYSRGSLTKIMTTLKMLSERKLVRRDSPPGFPSYLYVLSAKGLAYLRSLEIQTRPSAPKIDPSYYHIAHTLELNDWLILSRESGIEIKRSLHDYDLKKIGGTVIPDAFVEFWTEKPRCIALELDRGHMEEKRWRAKIAAYLQWVKGEYQTRFETTSLTVCVVAPTVARATRLLRWTEKELVVRSSQSLGRLFHFVGIDLSLADASTVFSSPIYQVPFVVERVSLL